MEEQIKKIFEQLEDHEIRIRELEGSTQPKAGGEADSEGSAKNQSTVLSIINKVGDCGESEKIKLKVIDQRGMEAKILLCFYISFKYFHNGWLTSGDIEKITSELGIKIDQRNVTNKLRELRQYLECASTRRKGQPTLYRLNRKGVKRFEGILNKGGD